MAKASKTESAEQYAERMKLKVGNLRAALNRQETLARRDLERPEANEPDAKGAYILKERAEAKLELIASLRVQVEGP